MSDLGIPTVECKLHPETADLRILIASDWHLGSEWCDMALVQRILAYADKQKAYLILCGDMLEMAIKRSVGSVHEQKLSPQEQLEQLEELFGPRAHRILACLTGNHEARTAREADIDVVSFWCASNKIPYLNKAGALAIHAHGQVWVVYAQHGVRGTGRKPGASLNAIHDMQENVVADIYLHGHHHRASVTKTTVLKYQPNVGFYWQRRWFINAGTMHRYGGYASDGAYPPTETGCYLVRLSKARSSGKYLIADLLDRQYFGMSN
jgi:hypothetical protein